MKNLCPCVKCRPRGMTLKQAMRRCREVAELERYGVEGVAERKRQMTERFKALKGANDV